MSLTAPTTSIDSTWVCFLWVRASFLIRTTRFQGSPATVLAVTPRDDHSVTVRLRYVMNDGRVDTEDRWLSVVPADGRLRVYDSERIGPA